MKGFFEMSGGFMLEVVLLVIFTIVLAKALGAVFNPDFQVAFLNAELLRSKINEACANGQSEMRGFSMPQPSPSRVAGLTDFIPRTAINLGGDPHYVLYFESFPPGEAIGWEVYQSTGVRIITPYTHASSTIQTRQFLDGMNHSIEDTYNEFQGKRSRLSLGTVDINIFVPNIILTSALNTFPEEAANSPRFLTGGEETLGDLGAWGRDSQANRFGFHNYYPGLSVLERSMIKYRACGDNALCLKTREAVYKFDLDRCKGLNGGKGVERIELKYDAPPQPSSYAKFYGGAAVAGGTILVNLLKLAPNKIVAFIARAISFLIPDIPLTAAGGEVALEGMFEVISTQKTSDFYIASPCKISGDIEVKKISCSQLSCQNTYRYPLYKVELNDKKDDLIVTQEGTHTACYDIIGNALDDVDVDAPDGECIRITVRNVPDGYCWTAEPTNLAGINYIVDKTQRERNIALERTIVVEFAKVVGLSPVRESTAYLDGKKSAVLLPNGAIDNKLKGLLNFLGKKWGWGWPGAASIFP